MLTWALHVAGKSRGWKKNKDLEDVQDSPLEDPEFKE